MRYLISFCAIALATSVRADAPRVAVDIAPVHGLVSQVMEGVGQPDLVIPLGASPHGYAMRPSEARSLTQADVVFWIGPDLTPWMTGPLENLASDAKKIELMAVPDVILLPFRVGARFEAHDHGEAHGSSDDHETTKAHDHGEEHTEEHGHEEHHDDDHAAEHGHEEHHDDDHTKEHGHDDHEHAHGAMDAHLWLDPENAAVWLDVIAAELSRIDPEHAEIYEENARDARAELRVISDEIKAELAELQDRPFIVFHDSYHYFEARFGIEAIAAITLGDAGTASAARLANVREVVAETGAACALAEPRVSKGLINAVADGSDIRVISLDAVGVDLPLGTAYYPSLLKQISDGLSDCLQN